MKFGSKTLAIVLLLIGLVLVNYLATSIPLRLDATAESIYTLSAGTKKMLGKIEEPVSIDLYFTKDAGGLPIAYKNYAVRVQEMLRQYVRASRGKLTLNIVNPRADTPEEEKATASGLQPQVAQQGGEPFFFGLIVTQADQQKTIPAFAPQREQFLEYDLSKLVYSVQQLDKRKLGLLTSLPLQGTNPQQMQMMMMMRQQPQPSQMIMGELEQSFKIITVEATAAELPADLDALLIAHPQNVSPKLQFAIDQFLLGGKPVFLAVDPSSQHFKRQSNPQQQMMGQPPQNVTSDLPVLLSAYGIAYDPQKVVGDLENATQVQTGQNSSARYPIWLSLRKPNFSAKPHWRWRAARCPGKSISGAIACWPCLPRSKPCSTFRTRAKWGKNFRRGSPIDAQTSPGRSVTGSGDREPNPCVMACAWCWQDRPMPGSRHYSTL